jgi:alkyl sulfatase BDS1-like metallo-beta-lactamase superfamily hydrolase
VINWRFTDSGETLVSTLQHGALTTIDGKSNPKADASVVTSRRVLEPVILDQRTLADVMKDGGMTVTGDAKHVSDLWALVVDFKTGIALIEPGVEPR